MSSVTALLYVSLHCLQMLATLAADPIAGLVDTAYMGRLGEPCCVIWVVAVGQGVILWLYSNVQLFWGGGWLHGVFAAVTPRNGRLGCGPIRSARL